VALLLQALPHARACTTLLRMHACVRAERRCQQAQRSAKPHDNDSALSCLCFPHHVRRKVRTRDLRLRKCVRQRGGGLARSGCEVQHAQRGAVAAAAQRWQVAPHGLEDGVKRGRVALEQPLVRLRHGAAEGHGA
jgi:hypothetical protein